MKLKPENLIGDHRLLTPGWPGELGPDEFDFLHGELLKDRQLSFTWGFRPVTKRRPQWAIRSVAMHGSPDDRKLNMGLARNAIVVESNGPNHA